MQAHFDSLIDAHNPAQACERLSEARVGEVLQRFTAGREVSDAELEQHITDSGKLIERCIEEGDCKGAQDAKQAMYAAIKVRDERHGAQRHAEFEQRLSDGVDFFGAQGRKDRAAMGRPGYGAHGR